MENKQRILYFDVLRIIATLAVVMLHVSAQGWYGDDVLSLRWFALNLYDSCVRWAVPVFVMISGALFLGRDVPLSKLFQKNILRLATAFVFWSALYALRDYFYYNLPLRQVIFNFTQGHYHMWFIYMIAGLYLLQPILRRVAEEEAVMRYFLLLSFVFTFLLPWASSLLGFAETGFPTTINAVLSRLDVSFGYVGYFVGGYYLSKRSISKREETVIYVLGVLGLIFTVSMTRYISIVQGYAYEKLYSYFAVNVLLTAIAVFVFGKLHLNFPSPSEKTTTAIRALSEYSFGSYLVHVMILELLMDYLSLTPSSFNTFLAVPLISLLVFAISMAISAILHQIPFVKKYLV